MERALLPDEPYAFEYDKTDFLMRGYIAFGIGNPRNLAVLSGVIDGVYRSRLDIAVEGLYRRAMARLREPTLAQGRTSGVR